VKLSWEADALCAAPSIDESHSLGFGRWGASEVEEINLSHAGRFVIISSTMHPAMKRWRPWRLEKKIN
jgi:hypothetical protein